MSGKPGGGIIGKYPVSSFFVLAFALSWGDYFLWKAQPGVPLLFPFGPLVAALLVAAIARGANGLKDIARRLLRWRVGIQWYAGALLVPCAIALAAAASNSLLGAPEPTAARLGPWYGLLILFPMALVDAPLWEETAWRGFALPGFPVRHSPLASTAVLGVLLCGWHLPLALGSPSAPAFLLGTFASAFLANWVYYNTGGSALMVVLYHTAANTMGLYFARMFTGDDLARQQWLIAAGTGVAAVAVILATGRMLRRQPASAAGPRSSPPL